MKFARLVVTNRKGQLQCVGKAVRSKDIAAKRSAAFAFSAIDSFQFSRQKGWKILLFERLALFL
jgi:hypothetical protein